MAGTNERSSAGMCSHQAEWAGRRSARTSGPWGNQEPGERGREHAQSHGQDPRGSPHPFLLGRQKKEEFLLWKKSVR